ncbi:Methyltransferase domain-containing protein [Streptomyces zhaozhouensis]|uniref:Methyltransferase domain-containing protein n=1 Tax=Streptomyces zhaozhouensis TaxID=1300267 RepID=A0A286DW15_9ACTN|nr:class I SAM-dependent methyltransferase [Streptomyces zhaozhouensis]SOD62852.1 Methyltransferase domain-containing protein [Streptomyces zhaozhouensis]
MSLHEFYDPELYERKLGISPRVGPLYLSELRDLAPGSTVLELGCGIGDVLLPFARLGHRVVGVDGSPGMLRRFRERLAEEELDGRAELHRCTLPALPDTGPADAIVMPYDLISHLLDDTQLDELLANCRRVGKPETEILLDVSRFDVEYLGSLAGATGALTRAHDIHDYLDDHSLYVSEQSRYTPETGVLACTFRYEELDASGRLVGTWFRQLRLYPRRAREVTAALTLAGFENVRVEDRSFPDGMDHLLFRATVGHG